ncbi:MFS transporter [Acuticoccus sediminis]|uniref:MFS transporter n=1 Tax=Acuticoccus sediminis TaxID=2184697 RepID=UPI001CFD1FD2|nr:MFS transporter [Acuticoccus sediminis]
MLATKIALLLVILIDVMGQGLAFPIFSALMLSETSSMVASGTSASTRQLLYGLVIAVFFIAWFFGSIYIARISDSVGRRRGILLCLTGALAGYALTILAIILSSFWLLVVSRVITGFTAGNQPIAQAALIDLAQDDDEKQRNLGLAVLGASLGLVSGPILGGLFSGGPFAATVQLSMVTPFVAGAAVVLATLVFVALVFHETSNTRVPLDIRPQAILSLLWAITRHPMTMRISIVYTLYMLSFVTFYIFFDTSLEERFGYSTEGQSVGMLVMGATLALTSLFLLPLFNRLASPSGLIVRGIILEVAIVGVFATVDNVAVAFIVIALMGALHAVLLPIFFGLYSQSASAEDQGWVMGVSIALFTLASAVASLAGGLFGTEAASGPFVFASIVGVTALCAIAVVWRGHLTGQPTPAE